MNAEKLKKLQEQVRIGGKGTPRRKKKIVHATAATDDKKLQSTLKKLGVNAIPGIEEVNMIRDDGSVIHFKNPKTQASLAANTFAITGHGENKQMAEMLPGILSQLGPDGLNQLKKIANNVVGNKLLNNSAAEEEAVMNLIDNFEDVSKKEAPKKDTAAPAPVKVEAKPEAVKEDAPKVEAKPEAVKEDAPKVEAKPEVVKPEAPKVEAKSEVVKPEAPKPAAPAKPEQVKKPEAPKPAPAPKQEAQKPAAPAKPEQAKKPETKAPASQPQKPTIAPKPKVSPPPAVAVPVPAKTASPKPAETPKPATPTTAPAKKPQPAKPAGATGAKPSGGQPKKAEPKKK